MTGRERVTSSFSVRRLICEVEQVYEERRTKASIGWRS